MKFPQILTLAFLTFTAAILFGSDYGFAQSTQSTQAESTNERVARIDQYLTQVLADWPVPGFAVAIVKDDKVIFSKGYGVRELGGSDPVDENTLFAIASNTKAFTAAALAILVEDGVLNWDDPVRKHLPWFKLYNDYVSEDMKVRDLLCHRSGLGTYSGDLLWYGTGYSTQQVLQRAKHLPQAGSFGRSYGYSNLMFLAAGEVITSVTGVDWHYFVRTRIIDPLEMKRTVTSTNDLKGIDNVATPHKTTIDGNTKLDWYNWDTMAAAGGIISSTSEMTNWIRLQLRNGETETEGQRIFSAASSAEMWKPHTLINISDAYRAKFPTTHFRAYGLGWSMRDFKGRKIVAHGGGYDGMYSRVVLVPEENLGVVVLTNAMTSVQTVACNRILDEFLGGDNPDWSKSLMVEFKKDRAKFKQNIVDSMTPKVTGTKPSLALENYAGTYVDEMYGEATIEFADDKLTLAFSIGPDFVAELTHMHLDTFAVRWKKDLAWFAGGNVQFNFDNQARITGMKMDIPNDDLWWHEFNFKRK